MQIKYYLSKNFCFGFLNEFCKTLGETKSLLYFIINPVIGSCNGILESVVVVSSADSCINQCVTEDFCEWWNFDSSTGICGLLSSCSEVNYSCLTCTYGSKNCLDIGTLMGNSLETLM